jgi:hypothetical protein
MLVGHVSIRFGQVNLFDEELVIVVLGFALLCDQDHFIGHLICDTAAIFMLGQTNSDVFRFYLWLL